MVMLIIHDHNISWLEKGNGRKINHYSIKALSFEAERCNLVVSQFPPRDMFTIDIFAFLNPRGCLVVPAVLTMFPAIDPALLKPFFN
jgi:hypothetical protein